MKTLRRVIHYSFFVQLILLLCLVGAATNLVLLIRDTVSISILFRLHLGFFILYAAQVAFIIIGEKYVSWLTFLQGVLALLTTADFAFVPLLQLVGLLYHGFASPTVEQLKVYQYLFISAAFTLQLASAAYLWGYFKISHAVANADL